jgi:hypothetical protein
MLIMLNKSAKSIVVFLKVKMLQSIPIHLGKLTNKTKNYNNILYMSIILIVFKCFFIYKINLNKKK